MMVRGEITVDSFVANLVVCNSYILGSYENEVDDLIRRAVVRKRCSIIFPLVSNTVRIGNAAFDNGGICGRITCTVKVTGQNDRIL